MPTPAASAPPTIQADFEAQLQATGFPTFQSFAQQVGAAGLLQRAAGPCIGAAACGQGGVSSFLMVIIKCCLSGSARAACHGVHSFW
jgi:hypothetical protein